MTSSRSFPSERSNLIGRERELAAVAALLSRNDVGLLTITGAGGIGKTRVAVEAAGRALAERSTTSFRDGGRMIEMADVAGIDGVLPAVAQALGVPASRDPLTRLQHQLRNKRMLLLIDNLEHLVAAGPQLGKLLRGCPGLKVVVTSRTVLRVKGEHVFPLGPLETPLAGAKLNAEEAGQFAAVRLFVERAQAAKPDFTLSPSNAQAVADICRDLDGLPLAIELAAAWSALLPPEVLLERLQHRLALLIGGPGDLPPRQRTMRSTIDWSFALLTEPERELLRTLAIFSGGWSIDAAEYVHALEGAESPPVIESLVLLANKSLIVNDPGQGGGAVRTRFRLLETVREYLLDLGPPGRRLRQRHAEYFSGFIATREAALRGPRQQETVAEIAAEISNVKVAWNWAVESRNTMIIGNALNALWLYYAARGNHAEGETLFGPAITALSDARTRDQRLTLGRLLRSQGSVCFRLGLFAQARGLLVRSINIFRDQEAGAELRFSLNQLAATAHLQGGYEEEKRLLEESISLAREAADDWLAAYSLNDLGMSNYLAGNTVEAKEYSQQSLANFDALGDRRGRAFALHNLGIFACGSEEYEIARSLLNGSLGLRRANDDFWGVASSLTALAVVARLQGEIVHAKRLLVEALESAARAGGVPLLLDAIVEVGALQLATQEPKRAVQLLIPLKASNSLQRETGEKLDHVVGAAGEALPDAGPEAPLPAVLPVAAWTEALVAALAPSPGQAERGLTMEQALGCLQLIFPLQVEGVPASSQRSAAEFVRLGPSEHERHRDDLSRREAGVLRLVAGGRSNQEIADELGLSVRTVEKHVSTIYEKLGLSGKTARAAATAYAFSSGLM